MNRNKRGLTRDEYERYNIGMMEFADRIKKARLLAGYETQQAGAKELGVERTRYVKWESGVYSPPLEILARICRVYNVSADYLLGLVDEPVPVTGGGLTTDEITAIRGFLRAMELWKNE